MAYYNLPAVRHRPCQRRGITVANATSADARASDSHWGTCVDLFAPGSSIDPGTGGALVTG